MNARQKGFSIIELIIYSGALSVFLLVLTNLFVTSLEVQLESKTTSAVTQDSRYLFSRFAYDINRAEAILTPETLGSQASTLSLLIGGATHSYQSVGDDLMVTTPTSSAALNSYQTKVSNLSFRRYGNVDGKNSVRIAFRLTSRALLRGEPESRDFDTTIALR
jgi:hypothetical protein